MLESIYKNNISELLHHSEWKLLRTKKNKKKST